jgi:hypothetical protein
MKPELSLRIHNILPYLQAEYIIEDYWTLQDILVKAETWDDLPKDAQDAITEAELAIKDNFYEDHIHNIELNLNEFDEQSKGLVQQQQGALQNVIVNIESKVVNEVLNKITNASNTFEDNSDIITQSDEDSDKKELEISLAAFFAVLIPLFASQTVASRAKEFGMFTNFKLNKQVKDYIKSISEKAADSHINTIVEDLRSTIKGTYDGIINDQLISIRESGRAVTDEDLVLARKKALEGASQQRIISAIKTEYSGNISTNRAKAIARTETNRAFTQSQYQADIQFIKQNGLEDQAYKQWTTQSANPCQICIDLANQPPIPFETNFADLGTELTATYEVDGKTKVLKQLVNFEPLSAGNAHVNCSCRYLLVIK